jgi:hypothetical protein
VLASGLAGKLDDGAKSVSAALGGKLADASIAPPLTPASFATFCFQHAREVFTSNML